MTRKLSLPLIHLDRGSLFTMRSAEKPTVDAVRERLGGRASTEPGAGELVTLSTADGRVLHGVVLFTRGDKVDVWIEALDASSSASEGGRRAAPSRAAERAAPSRATVYGARRGDIAPLRVPATPSLEAVALDARVFASLAEGQRIRFQDGGGLSEGTLIEKCRFGGLVRRDDGVVLGVGFRRLWPAQGADAERH